MSFITLDKHLQLIPSNMIHNICAPLFKNFGISYFLYMRLYPDGSRLFLTTHPDFVKWVYDEDQFVSGAFEYAQNGIHLVKQLPKLVPDYKAEKIDNQLFAARNYFNIDLAESGLDIIYRENTQYHEVFEFAASPPGDYMLHTYFNNLDILRHFVHFFNDKSRPLIDLLDKNRFKPQQPIIKPVKYFADKEFELARNKFFRSTVLDSLIFTDQNTVIRFTRRELESLFCLMAGFTAKETARILNISSKSIESYIGSAKQKLGCSRKSNLIKKALQLNLLNLSYMEWLLTYKLL